VRAIEKGGWQLRWCILSAWICEVRRHQEARDQKERKGINPFTKGPVVFKARSARKIIRARPVKLLRSESREDAGPAARRERHNHPHRPRGIARLLIFAMTSLPVFAQKAAVNPPTRANVLAQHQPAAWFSHHTSPKGCGSMARRMHLRSAVDDG
jgi:hypothetical protein